MSDFEEKYDETLEKLKELVKERQYNELKREFTDLYPTDIAFLLDDMPEEYRPVCFRLLPKDIAADVFVELESDSQEMLIKSFSNTELESILDELYLDDTVDIIEEMPSNVVKRILKYSDPDTRKEINKILQYPEDSAGSIMTTEFIKLRQSNTVEQAFDIIRKNGDEAETINVCYVTDEGCHLQGYVTIRTLVLEKDTSTKIADIMDTQIISVSTRDDKEDVAQDMSKYDFDAMPVVDSENRIVGIVTFDDAIDVMEEETTEDIEKMAAITPMDKPYLRTSTFELWKARIPWLLLLMISATFTGMIITSFEDALASYVALTAFIPMLMDTGGNSGSQASVTVIRGISLQEIEFKDILKVVWKELRVALFCGITLAAVSFAKIMLFDGMVLGNTGITPTVALTVCLTLVLTVVCAKVVGCIMPLLAEKLGFDPAVMASPFITTIVDAISLLIYFGFAKALLGV